MSYDFQLLYYTFNMSNMFASDQFLLTLSLYVHSLIFNYFTGSNSSMIWATSYLLFVLVFIHTCCILHQLQLFWTAQILDKYNKQNL
jgi:hypothetical protein